MAGHGAAPDADDRLLAAGGDDVNGVVLHLAIGKQPQRTAVRQDQVAAEDAGNGVMGNSADKGVVRRQVGQRALHWRVTHQDLAILAHQGQRLVAVVLPHLADHRLVEVLEEAGRDSDVNHAADAAGHRDPRTCQPKKQLLVDIPHLQAGDKGAEQFGHDRAEVITVDNPNVVRHGKGGRADQRPPAGICNQHALDDRQMGDNAGKRLMQLALPHLHGGHIHAAQQFVDAVHHLAFAVEHLGCLFARHFAGAQKVADGFGKGGAVVQPGGKHEQGERHQQRGGKQHAQQFNGARARPPS